MTHLQGRWSRIVLNLLGMLTLAVMALLSSTKIAGTHLNIVDSDTLYIPLLYEQWTSGFRTPPSTYFFPDLLYYATTHLFTADVVRALIIAGLLQSSINTIAIIRYCGIFPALAYNALYYVLCFPPYFAISVHQGIILLTILYLRFEDPKVRRGMSLLFTLADPLFSMVAAAVLAVRAFIERRLDVWETGCICLGYLAAFYLCESAVHLIKLAPVLVLLLSAGWISTLRRPHHLMVRVANKVPSVLRRRFDPNSVCALFLLCAGLASLLAGQPTRYVVPMLVCSIIFYTWKPHGTRAERNASRKAWIPAVSLGVISFGLFFVLVRPALEATSQADAVRYVCLADTLHAMQVGTIATDYWTFKRLHFLRPADANFAMLQVDFRDGTPNTTINSHRYMQGKADYIVRDAARCETTNRLARDWLVLCNEGWYTSTLGVKDQQAVCNGFTIVRTEREVDFTGLADAFNSKHAAFFYNLTKNFGKVKTHLVQ